MAASSPEKDYFHLVKTWLDKNYDTVNALAYNFSVWEILHTDRAETLDVLDAYLSSNLNLITIQLGENVSNLDTFESDFEYLLNYVKEKAPDAQILVLGEIMDKSIKDEIKERATEKCGLDFISFDKMQENAAYQCGKGTTVYDKDGNAHIVEHDGVALHPNDKAMKYIADRITKKISNCLRNGSNRRNKNGQSRSTS